MLQPQVFSDHETLSRTAAEWLFQRLRDGQTSLLCLAAGTTPTACLRALAEHGESRAANIPSVPTTEARRMGRFGTDDASDMRPATSRDARRAAADLANRVYCI